MTTSFDSTNEDSVANFSVKSAVADRQIDDRQIDERGTRKPGCGVKLIDVSWLVGNLYLEDADKEKLRFGDSHK